MDAANVDLKAFSEKFYKERCFAELAPVLETLKYLKDETHVWFEITTLLIPGHNDSDAELHEMTQWIAEELGRDVPLHFTAFHPDYKMMETPSTPSATLTRARRIALDAGLHYVYTGNVHDAEGGSTYCPGCDRLLVERDWYQLGAYAIDDGCCKDCGLEVAGRFGPGREDWGRRRKPVHIG
jgi:pyruvate formate lyase activating enzyme